MKITDFLTKQVIILELNSTEKYQVIDELINLFVSDPRVTDIENVRKSVIEREMIMSTGVGKGVAVPHGKSDSIKDVIVAFGRSSVGIDYEAIDNKPVYLFFLIVGRNDMVSQHIKLISRISKMMNKDDFRNLLLNATSVDEIYNIFAEEEKNFITS